MRETIASTSPVAAGDVVRFWNLRAVAAFPLNAC
jgi:hypothetical protein